MDDKKLRYVSFLADLSRRDIHVIHKGDGYVLVRDKLTQLVIERHLLSSPAIGQYMMKGDKTQVAILDLDSHDGLMAWEEMVLVALMIIAAAGPFGLRVHAFRSGGSHGIHLWFLWEKPQNARYVRHLLGSMLASIGLRDGTGGVAKGEVEIFPKQDRVESGKFGNPIALPGARASIALDAKTLCPTDWEALDIPDVMMRVSDPVPELADEEQQAASFERLVGDEDEARAALKHIPAADYHTWFKIMCALKHTFGNDGLPIFVMWSATCVEKYPGPEEIERRWNGLVPNGRIGIGSIFYLARRHGWNGPSNPMIREMNARFGILTTGNATLIIVKNGDRRPEDDLVVLSKNVFVDRLAPETFTTKREDGSVESISKAKLWLGHRLAAHYHRLEFDPGLPPGHNGKTWNTWTGFGVEPRAGDWSLLKAHVLDNICRRDQRLFEWLLNWMAYGLQNRSTVIGTAPVLIGMPGTGKSILAHAYGRLWGAHYVVVTHPEHVIGRFSGHLMSKRFVFIDEGTFGGNKKDAGLLKTRITEPMLMFERKGIDPIRMANRMLFMVASNDASVVPADKNDRRWMVLDVGDERREDHAYFGAIQSQLADGGSEAMLHELLHRDLTQGPDPRRIIKTEALFEQVLHAQGGDIGYIHMILENGRLPQNWVDGPSVTTIRAMHEDLRRRFPEARYVSEIRLGKLLRKIFSEIEKEPNGRFFVMKAASGFVHERSTRYIFPDLADARRQFQRYIGAPVDWNDDIDEWQNDPEPELPGGEVDF